MKLKTASLFIVPMLVIGCQTKGDSSAPSLPNNIAYSQPVSQASAPLFHFVDSFDGNLAGLGGDGTVVYTQGRTVMDVSQAVSRPPHALDMHSEENAMDKQPRFIRTKNASSPVPAATFVDYLGNPGEHLHPYPIQETILGRLVTLEALRCASTKYRYYASNGTVYYRGFREKDIHPLCPGKAAYFMKYRNDQIALITDMDSPGLHILFASPGKEPIRVNIPAGVYLVDFLDEKNFLVQTGSSKAILYTDGRQIEIDGANVLAIVRLQSGVYALGYSFDTSGRHGIYNQIPCLWKSSSPIDLTSACPGLIDQIPSGRVSGINFGYATTANGWVAMQASVKPDSSDSKTGYQEPISRIFLLKDLS